MRALKELARILRVGGRILITVWAKEQRHRKVSQPAILYVYIKMQRRRRRRTAARVS